VAKGSKTGPSGGASFNFDRRMIAEAIVTGCATGTLRGLIQLQSEIKTTLSQAGSGTKHPGLRYRSSAPGRPPAVQTGHLRRSWQTGQPKRLTAARRLGWSIGSNLRYAAALEFGTARIFSRPYLRPSIREISETLGQTMQNAIRIELRKLGLSKR
jgi:hypothetical protein